MKDVTHNFFKPLFQVGTDTVNPNFCQPPPCEKLPFKTETTPLPKKKSLCLHLFDRIATTINTNTQPNSHQIFTDGSVDKDSGHSGSAVFSNYYSTSWRLPNNCSTLQTEHTLILIYTDSLTSILTLNKQF